MPRVANLHIDVKQEEKGKKHPKSQCIFLGFLVTVPVTSSTTNCRWLLQHVHLYPCTLVTYITLTELGVMNNRTNPADSLPAAELLQVSNLPLNWSTPHHLSLSSNISLWARERYALIRWPICSEQTPWNSLRRRWRILQQICVTKLRCGLWASSPISLLRMSATVLGILRSGRCRIRVWTLFTGQGQWKNVRSVRTRHKSPSKWSLETTYALNIDSTQLAKDWQEMFQTRKWTAQPGIMGGSLAKGPLNISWSANDLTDVR